MMPFHGCGSLCLQPSALGPPQVLQTVTHFLHAGRRVFRGLCLANGSVSEADVYLKGNTSVYALSEWLSSSGSAALTEGEVALMKAAVGEGDVSYLAWQQAFVAAVLEVCQGLHVIGCASCGTVFEWVVFTGQQSRASTVEPHCGCIRCHVQLSETNTIHNR